jgi:hypothetical protein
VRGKVSDATRCDLLPRSILPHKFRELGVVTGMNVLRMRTRLPLGVLLLASACGLPDGTDQPPAASASSPLLGLGVTVERGNCTGAEISDQQLLDFGAMAGRALERGRAAANSKSFRECLQRVIVTGNVTMPYEETEEARPGWGPYCPPGGFPGVEQSCGTFTGRDAHWSRLGADVLTLTQLRRFYAARARIEAHSPNNLILRCETGNGTAFVRDRWGEDRTAPEIQYWSAAGITGALSRDSAPADVRDREYRGQAAIYWHEVMHVHKYGHDGDEERKKDQIPSIVGACIRDALGRGETMRNNGSCPSSCANRGYPVPTTFQGRACECSADPSFPASPRATRSWTGINGAPTIVVDSFDNRVLRKDADGKTFVLTGSGGWTSVSGTSSEVYAGGNVLVRRGAGGEVLRSIDGGSWTNLGTAGTNSLAIDDIGTVYRRSATKIDMRRVGGSAWEDIGSTSGVIVAGGDQFFATDPNTGVIRRYGHESGSWFFAGGPAAWFTVDAFGTLYGLSPDQQSIFRNRGRDVWERFGGDGAYLVSSARFYARGLNNERLWRPFPNGQWVSVGTCTNATAGGTSVWCVNRDGANWRIDAFERD